MTPEAIDARREDQLAARVKELEAQVARVESLARRLELGQPGDWYYSNAIREALEGDAP